MGSAYFLNNLPKPQVLKDLARRYPSMDPEASETTMVLLKAASDIIARIDALMAHRRLSQGKFCVLMQLLVAKEGIPPSELAGRIGVTRATITGLLDGLERDGLLKRDRPAEDRRSFAVRMTPKGEKLLAGMLPGHFRRTASLMSHLSAAEKKTLRSLLAKVSLGIAALEKP